MRNWENYIRKVEPYVPGEQPKIMDVIKLNTNENPYPPTKNARKAALEYDYDRLRLYPDPDASVLVEAIGRRYNIPSDQIFVGVGSDDVISMCFLTFFNSDKPILFPDISYSFYSVWAELYKVPYKQVELDEHFNIVPDSFKQENGGIIFPNPNAPTAVYLGLDKVEEIIKANQDSVVIIDEAYIDFGGKSAIEFVNKYDNVLVVQTYSKSRSMAGMRIGYAFGSKTLIKALYDVKFSFNSYTMDAPTLVYGVEAMNDEAYFNQCVNKIIKTREYTCKKLTELGFTYPESKANFVFAKHEKIHASVLFEELKKRNIFVRYFNKPLIDNYLRITIGTDEQMERFFDAVSDILEDNK